MENINAEMIYQIVVTLLTILLGFLSTYFKKKTELEHKVNEVIADAEKQYENSSKSGGEKFEYVVNTLYNLIPKPLQLFFTRDTISKIVQDSFDGITKYTETKLDKLVDKVTE